MPQHRDVYQPERTFYTQPNLEVVTPTLTRTYVPQVTTTYHTIRDSVTTPAHQRVRAPTTVQELQAAGTASVEMGGIVQGADVVYPDLQVGQK